MKKRETTKEVILASAMTRFKRYGYHKTTMAEIAADCDMSAGNLYRYFKNKGDIITELALCSFTEKEQRLRELIDQARHPAPMLLLEMVLSNLRHTYAMTSSQSHLNEIIEFIIKERRPEVDIHRSRICALYKEVLDAGVQTGHFMKIDTKMNAEAFFYATIKFFSPQVMSYHTLEELESLAGGVIHLILHGLLAKRSKES